MKTRITYKFILKIPQNREGLNPVYFRAFLQRKKIEIATTVTLTADDWSDSKQRVKKRNRSHETYNAILEAFEKKALKCILNNFIYEEIPLTLNQFKDYMLSIGHRGHNSFTDFILNYLNENKSRLRLETWTGYRSQISKMLKFKKQISFTDISEKFITDYRSHMLHKLNNNENTVSKSLRALRTFVNIAMRYGYMKNNPFKYFTIKKVDGKRDFLTTEELNSLTEAYFFNQTITTKEKKVLQYFLFSCYTGLRYSDLKSLRMSSIKNNSLHINMHKTSLTVNIPLSRKALHLLPSNNNPKSDCVFHVLCNKTTNQILKQIGQKFGISKKLTCHVARHTFATVSITLGIPIEVVSKLLGHTNLKTTQIYAKIVDNVKEREMEKWNRL